MLSNDDKQILYELYYEYLRRRKVGLSKYDSVDFVSGHSVHENFFPNLLYDDVDYSLRILGENGYLHNCYADGEIYACELSNDSIAYMESLPVETFLSVADFISKFIPW